MVPVPYEIQERSLHFAQLVLMNGRREFAYQFRQAGVFDSRNYPGVAQGNCGKMGIICARASIAFRETRFASRCRFFHDGLLVWIRATNFVRWNRQRSNLNSKRPRTNSSTSKDTFAFVERIRFSIYVLRHVSDMRINFNQ